MTLKATTMGRLLTLLGGVVLSTTTMAQTAIPPVRDPEATNIATTAPLIEGGVTLDAQPAVVVQPVAGQVDPAFAAIMPTPEQIEFSKQCAEEQLARRAASRVPQSPVFRPFDRMPPETTPPADGGASGTRAPGDFLVYSNVTLGNAAHNGATSTTNEPSLGGNGKVMFYSGNWYLSFSTDYGQTWTYRNPYTSFGANPPSGGFCCDQVVYYDWTRNLMVLYQQYGGSNNPGRVIVYRSQQDIVNNNWIRYDITPTTLGFAATANFDFPDMAASLDRLYITTNTGGTPGTGAVCIRLNLDELAAGSPITVEHFRSPLANLRATQETAATMYVGTQVNTSTLRVFSWPQANAAPTSVDRAVNSWFGPGPGVSSAPSPDGTNWVARDFNDILGAAYSSNSGGRLLFMWGSAQGGGFPWPNVRWVQFDTAINVVSQGAIWSTVTAWAYPTISTNARGHWGGLISAGGGSGATPPFPFPNLYAWLADDFNGQSLSPFESVFVAAGTNGPAGNRWGDYYTCRRHSPYQNTFVGGGFVLSGGTGGAAVRPRFVWFGRERDQPPASNTIYVDQANTGLRQEGTQAFPYRTVASGLFAAENNDTIRIRAGTYLETPFVTGRTLFFRGWAPGVTGNSLIGGN